MSNLFHVPFFTYCDNPRLGCPYLRPFRSGYWRTDTLANSDDLDEMSHMVAESWYQIKVKKLYFIPMARCANHLANIFMITGIDENDSKLKIKSKINQKGYIKKYSLINKLDNLHIKQQCN